MTGKTLSHYEILDKLGEGGMGAVYKARDTRLDRLVALKLLPPFASEEDRQRFMREAKTISALNHPHIAILYDLGEDQEQQFLVLEYLPGGTLKQQIASLTQDRALELATQIAQGLAHAHHNNIVHRDIKPENILLTREGLAKIVDFGLARLQRKSRLTRAGSTVGTLAYMSPEQLQGIETDSRTDIWAFGVMLFEMLTGDMPFRGEHEAAIMYSVVNEEPDIEKIPQAFQPVLKSALTKELNKRVSSMNDVLKELLRIKESPKGTYIEDKTTPNAELGRRLSAIMFTDIAGYSRHMERDEATTLRLLDVHNNIIAEVIARFGGRVIKTIGDAFMVEFDSAVHAVECAIEVQQRFHSYNKSIPGEVERILIRIGIHLGDVVVRGADIYGDGVNIASRIVPLAEPGGICISKAIHDQVKNRMDIKAVMLGPKRLKNIAEPVEVFRLAIEPSLVPEVRQGRAFSLMVFLQRLMRKRQFLYSLIAAAVAAIQVFVLPNLLQKNRQTDLAGFPNVLLSGDTEGPKEEDFLNKDNNDDTDMYRTMILMLRGMNKNDEVIGLARKYVKTKPNNTSAWLTLAFALELDKQYNEAATIYEKAAQIEPGNVDARIGLGRTSLLTRNFDESKKNLELVLAIDPNRKELPKLLWKLGDGLAGAQRYPEAVPLYQKATQLMAKQGKGK